MLKQISLWEDCIKYLFMAGRHTHAEELANKCLEEADNPGILCLLGDIKRDPSYYQKAWDMSGHKYARAMRSIARNHFFKGEYKEAVTCFDRALSISRLFPDSWFTLGCSHMRIEDW